MVRDKHSQEAIKGLAYSIKKFPAEGRYVPKMLDKLEKICTQTGGTQDKLLLFYQQFLPMIPKARGDRPSPYCMQMYQRAIDRFKKAGQTQTATSLETQLAQLKASVPKM